MSQFRVHKQEAMSKYRKLTSRLASLDRPQWMAKFAEIEAILGFRLPKSAYSYPAWWSNQAGEGHSQSTSWQSIGWRTGELDLRSQQVSFFRRNHDSAEHRGANAASSGGRGEGLTIAQAKAGLANYFGVPPESVEITIKG